MLYESLSGSTIFLWMCLGGFLCGFLFDLKTIILHFLGKKFKKINFFSQILMFFCVFFAIFVFYALNLKTNYGQFRLFPIASFLLAFSIQRFLMRNLLAKIFAKWYNHLNGRKKQKTE